MITTAFVIVTTLAGEAGGGGVGALVDCGPEGPLAAPGFFAMSVDVAIAIRITG